MKLKATFRLALLAAPLAWTSGCATSALWEEGRFAQFREPASPPHLAAFQSREGEDVLICYDEVREDDSGRRRRAYWLAANHEPVKNPHKPRFVPIKCAAHLAPVPVFEAAATRAPAAAGLHVITNGDGQAFELRCGDERRGEYELPVYREASGRVKQVLLTPLAFAADVTVVGGFLFLAAWSEGELSDLH